MAKSIVDIRSIARGYTVTCLEILMGIAAEKAATPAARVAACGLLLDRGWGKAPQAHTGADGEGDIKVTIRHIIDNIGKPVVIEHDKPVLLEVEPD